MSCSSIGRSVRGRSLQSFFASPKPILPSVTPSFPHRNSTRPVHAHSLLPCPFQSFPHNGDLTLSDAQRSTIYALSTPPGKGGVAVIRVSGPDARKVWRAVTRPLHASLINKPPIPRLAELRHVIDPLTGEKLDDGLVLFFKGEFSHLKSFAIYINTHIGPKSFTTEDVIELQVHSGRAVLSSVLRALSRLPYCRPAQPGEFTRRAFEGGRVDLTQVEGLRDLIDAETDAQRRVAVSSAGVGITARIQYCFTLTRQFATGRSTSSL